MAINLNKDIVYRSAKAETKNRMINDGGGLYLLVKVSGHKWWYFVYTCRGRRKKLSLGVYPSVTLEAARDKAAEARESVATGIDPGQEKAKAKKAQKHAAENEKRLDAGLPVVGSFADTAYHWLDYLGKHPSKRTGKVIAPLTLEKKTARLKTYILPTLGS